MVETNKGTRQEFVVFLSSCIVLSWKRLFGRPAEVRVGLPWRGGEALIPPLCLWLECLEPRTRKRTVSGYIQKAVDLKQPPPPPPPGFRCIKNAFFPTSDCLIKGQSVARNAKPLSRCFGKSPVPMVPIVKISHCITHNIQKGWCLLSVRPTLEPSQHIAQLVPAVKRRRTWS